MKYKYLVFVIIAILMISLIWFWGNSPAPEDKWNGRRELSMEESYEQTPAPTAKLPTVSSVVIAIQEADGDTLPGIRLRPGEVKKLPGSDLSISATDFYTHWNWNKGPINLSYHEFNPAIRITIFEGSTEKYSAWGFKNMPFFKMSKHMGSESSGQKDDRMAFTLLEYEGLKIPGENAE